MLSHAATLSTAIAWDVVSAAAATSLSDLGVLCCALDMSVLTHAVERNPFLQALTASPPPPPSHDPSWPTGYRLSLCRVVASIAE